MAEQPTNVWKFTQLDGPKDTLILAGYEAPFGRPRQKAILKDKLTVRQQVTRYPDSIIQPTRHIFGSHREDQEITGRWMDRKLGKGAAQQHVTEWERFVNAKVRIQITWGNILSYKAFIESIETAWESPTEVAWTMRLLIDSKDDDVVARGQTTTPLPDKIAQMNTDLAIIGKGSPSRVSVDKIWEPDLFDIIGTIASKIAIVTSAIAGLANGFDNLKTATIAQLHQLKAACHQLKTAMNTFELALDPPLDTALSSRESESDMKHRNFQFTSSISFNEVLAVIAGILRDIDIAERGNTFTNYTARTGDTWESISQQFYGNVDGAADIRAANGIKFGNLPAPGTKYFIPRQQ